MMLRASVPLLARQRSLLFGVRCAAAAVSPLAQLAARRQPQPLALLGFSNRNSSRSPPVVLRFSTSSSSSSSSAAGAAATDKPLSHFERLKDLWRKYGVVAIGTYLGMYGAVLGSIYVAIDLGWVSTARAAPRDGGKGDEDFNLVTATNKFVTFAEELGIAKYLEVEHVNAKTGTFLIAWIATKFTEPLRLAVTLAITPRVARFFGRAPQLKPKVKKP